MKAKLLKKIRKKWDFFYYDSHWLVFDKKTFKSRIYGTTYDLCRNIFYEFFSVEYVTKHFEEKNARQALSRRKKDYVTFKESFKK